MMSAGKRLGLVLFAAVLAPVLIIGVLLGAMSNADTATERIPIALVTNDEIIIETDEDGKETFFLASRPLVLELVGSDDLTLDWVITDSERGAEMLETGEVYAIFEIPENFSEAVQTLETDEPEAASFVIRTNPARSYLAGVVAEQIGTQVASALNDEFGREILSGLFTVIVDLGDAFTEAADASREISDGVNELADGVVDLRDGTADLADGYVDFDSGLGEYLDGVNQLADGLETFERETRELPQLADGVATYTSGVSQAIAGLQNQLNLTNAGLAVSTDPQEILQLTITQQLLEGLVAQLTPLSSGGATLSQQTNVAIDGVRDGLEESADGARELADAGVDLRDGSDGIVSGTRDLANGVSDLNDGVSELADGAAEFADGLTEGAEEIAAESPGEVADETLDTLITPVVSETDSGETEAGATDSLAALIVPLGMWLASVLAVVLLPAPGMRILSSTVSSTTLVVRQLGSTLALAMVQGLVALTLLHTLGGVSLTSLGWTLPLVLVGSLALTALHYAVWAGAPRALIPLSLSAFVAQIATLGVILPAEILPSFYAAVAGWGPISWLSDGLLGAAAADTPSRMAGSLIGLLLLGVVSALIARWLFGRRRHTLVREYYLTGVAG